MNPVFISRQLSFLAQNVAITLVLLGLHSYLLSHFGTMTYMIPIWQVYVFHFAVTTLVYSVINYQYSRGKTEIFTLFMGFTLLKMILAIVFRSEEHTSELQSRPH